MRRSSLLKPLWPVRRRHHVHQFILLRIRKQVQAAFVSREHGSRLVALTLQILVRGAQIIALNHVYVRIIRRVGLQVLRILARCLLNVAVRLTKGRAYGGEAALVAHGPLE